jgi:ribosome-associated protein
MSRKPKKGYYVRGHFVAEGSELDIELKHELKGTDAEHTASRTDLKKESDALQSLGEDLLALRSDMLAKLSLPDKLADALAEVRRITNFEGRRRQMQFIGKLMRKLDADTVEAARAALAEQRTGPASEARLLREAEAWRDALIADDEALDRWMPSHPGTDTQQLRALIRQARKDAKPERPGEALRHGRAYRDIFQLVRTHLRGAVAEGGADIPDSDDDGAGTGGGDGDGD